MVYAASGPRDKEGGLPRHTRKGYGSKPLQRSMPPVESWGLPREETDVGSRGAHTQSATRTFVSSFCAPPMRPAGKK